VSADSIRVEQVVRLPIAANAMCRPHSGAYLLLPSLLLGAVGILHDLDAKGLWTAASIALSLWT